MAKLNLPKNHLDECDQISDTFPKDKLIFVYDGVCVLCSGGAHMVAKRDKKNKIRFISGQSGLGKALFEHYGMPSTNFSAQLVLLNGEAFTGFDALAKTVEQLPFGWLHIARLFQYLPFKGRLYSLIARNRFRFFGRRNSCMIVPKELANRFLA